MNFVERFFIARDLHDLLLTEPRPHPATFRELLNEMTPALRDWVLARPGPTMAYDSKLRSSPSLQLELHEIALLHLRQVELDIPEEKLEQFYCLVHEIARSGPPVRTTGEQTAALQMRLNAWVLQKVGDGAAPRQNDTAFIAEAITAVPGSTWRMVNEAIRMLPQAPRRRIHRPL
jgi:hypothetical protein